MDAPLEEGIGETLLAQAQAALAVLSEHRARTLKHGDTFAVFDPNGDIRPGTADGIYHLDTRHLSRLDLLVNGRQPVLLSSTVRDDNAMAVCDLGNPVMADGRGGTMSQETLHLRRTRFLFDGKAFERVHVRNFSPRDITCDLEFRFAADFADIFEVRGHVRSRRGSFAPAQVTRDGIRFAYTGLDGKRRTTSVRIAPEPVSFGPDRAHLSLSLKPGQSVNVFLEIVLGDAGPDPRHPAEAYLSCLAKSRRELRTSSSRAASIETSNEIFNEALRRSIADIYMLTTETPHGPYPYAGIPWFSTAFGRDAIVTAFETLWIDPTIAKGVLRYLAAHQATEVDADSDAEPGKILHEVRRGEMAETGEVPFRRYYGSVDATPLFVMLAGAYLERTGDLATVEDIWPNIEAALTWLERYGDRDGDGFVEYYRATASGLVNQGWKDSFDAVFHANGTLAEGPIALCEVQGYTYAALNAAAMIAERLGKLEYARLLPIAARDLCSKFDKAFWSDDIGTYALALDGMKRPCRVRTSNAGQALWTGIALPQRAAVLERTLMSKSGFSGWGVRTLAAGEARYNPMSYHNGSVWPHDNALIAAGLARYGRKQSAARIFEALFNVSVYTDLRRLPELFCGFMRLRGQGPTCYPVACNPQAWAAAAPIALLQSCLGLTFDVPRQRIELNEPMLPQFLEWVTVRNLAMAGNSVDFTVRRASPGSVTVDVVRRSGSLRLEVTC